MKKYDPATVEDNRYLGMASVCGRAKLYKYIAPDIPYGGGGRAKADNYV